MIALYRILPIALLIGACAPKPSAEPKPAAEPKPTAEPKPAAESEPSAEQPETPEPSNYVYLYARLHESQPKADAEAQYLKNLREALADYESTIEIEEIRGSEDTVEFIGIDMKIAAPESETEALDMLLMNTLRVSGAPYATQIFIVTP